MEKVGDPMYRFGHQQVGVGGPVDPSSQTEDLGDNAITASEYGIKNLKRIMNNLEVWTTKEGETYEDMTTMYGQILGQFNRYVDMSLPMWVVFTNIIRLLTGWGCIYACK